jgi:ElaB/YqjD/DUF883 family membrane-anchored ribosome-binding protein
MPRSKKQVLDEIETRIAGAADLSVEEKAEIRDRAKKHVAEARKTKATEELLKLAIAEEEREHEPHQVIEDFYVDLPPYAPFIKINNVMYFHGIVYEVPYHKARAMADIAWRAWNHEREFKEGKSAYDANRRPLHLALSPHSPQGRVTTTDNMRGG